MKFAAKNFSHTLCWYVPLDIILKGFNIDILSMSNLNKRSKSNCFKKKNASLSKKKVLSMFVAMEQKAAEDAEEFFTSGRTGRRNAMADILGIHATTTTADMPERLQALTTNSPCEMNENVPMESTSSSQVESTTASNLSSTKPSGKESSNSNVVDTALKDVSKDESENLN